MLGQHFMYWFALLNPQMFHTAIEVFAYLHCTNELPQLDYSAPYVFVPILRESLN